MTINQRLLVLAAVCIVAGGAIYGIAAIHERSQDHGAVSITPHSQELAKIAAAQIPDGTYVVAIHTITSTPEDTAITFYHATYAEGSDAKTAAAKDVSCSDKAIELCAPSVAYGFYASSTSALSFTAPITYRTTFNFKDNAKGTFDDLRNLRRSFQPIFDVVISKGNVVSITEKSPLTTPKN